MSSRASFLSLAVLTLSACFEGTVIDPAGSGGSGGQGAAGGEGAQGATGGAGAGGPCADDAECADANECAVGACIESRCAVVNIPAGTAPATQPIGDCLQLECDGAGAIVSAPDVEDAPSDQDCTFFTCSAAGEVETTYAPAGTSCGVELTCNGSGTCVGCVEPADCPSTDCEEATCVAEQCGLAPRAMGTVVPGDAAQNCMKTVCDGIGTVITVPDDADVPASDSNPCTTEACSSGAPVHTPKMVGITVTPENGVSCNGVCQTGAYAGQCGLRLYSRTFPAAGAWSSQALSAVSGWSSANAPPPDAITAAEETSNGSRLIVVRQAGATSTYYEYISGAWQTPVPLSSIQNLGAPALASLGMGNYGGAGELAIFASTSLVAYQYAVPATGALVHQGTTGITNPGDAWRCQQGTYPILWSFNEQRSPYGQNPAPRTWKYCNGMVYEENNNDFTGMSAPTTEAASPFQINGVNGSPAPGTIAAAYYRKPTNTVFMIAP